ncbi:short chain dehydrogenase, partial [Burkholderia sp. TJI49]
MAEHAPVVSLAGRRVLVTGGARGLGAAFVKALVEAGAQVAFGDVLADEGRALAAQLAQAGHAAHFVALDLADPASVAAFVEQGAAALGGIDGLINNAAITNSGGRL